MLKKKVFAYVLLFISTFLYSQQSTHVPKNIIIMIGDGMGFEHVRVAEYFEGLTDKSIFDEFPVSLAMSTFPGELSKAPNSGYNSLAIWTDVNYAKDGFTESAAAGTALGTGIKTKNDKIGITIQDEYLLNLPQIAKYNNKSAGLITSVQISHATPAGFGAHQSSRNNYEEIAREMILHSKLDVLMGAGHPYFDDDGKIKSQADYQYVGGKEVWEQLKVGNQIVTFQNSIYSVQPTKIKGTPTHWTVSYDRTFLNDIIQRKVLPERLLFVAPVETTLGQERSGKSQYPFDIPIGKHIPTLAEMSLAGIEVLSQNPNGFFLMIEGGAIDWASHYNDIVRVIEEQIHFTNTIEEVINWLTKNNMWEETLLIVTADHECGYLAGAWDTEKGFVSVQDKGKGHIPEHIFLSIDHTNHLVPFYAKGRGMENFPLFASNYDYIRGYYLDITDIASYIKFAWGTACIAYPAYVVAREHDEIEVKVSVPFPNATYQWYGDGKPIQSAQSQVFRCVGKDYSEVFCIVDYGFVSYQSNAVTISVLD